MCGRVLGRLGRQSAVIFALCGRFWGAFLGYFRGSGRLRGAIWPPGAPGTPPGPPRGASRAPLGRLWAAPRAPRGPKLAPWGPPVGYPMGSKRLPKWIVRGHLLRRGEGTPKGTQNGAKMKVKCRPSGNKMKEKWGPKRSQSRGGCQSGKTN